MGPLVGLTLGWGRWLLFQPASTRMAKVSPFKFMQEVRSEMQKVTWPSRRETGITTAMVFVMVAIAAVFFLLADQIMRVVVTFVLGLAG